MAKKNKHVVGVNLPVAAAVAALLSAPALAGSLTGRVSDPSGTKYLQSAEVTLVELDRHAETGPDGAFRFQNVPDGAYTLRVRYVGADTAEIRVTVAGDTRDQHVRLAASAEILEDVLVVGQRASMSSSLSRQRAADGVENVLSRDGIGQFPDQNVAESLRRIPGINVLNDQGEGRFVAVRGLDPDLNSASINGARVPAPEADVRMVALDVIPSDLIESIEIRKSLTPDMDGDTIGASLEINTTRAFDRQKPYLSATAEGSYNDLNDKWSPKGGVDFSTRLGERFGIAGGVSYYQREFSTDNIEVDGWDEADGVSFADTVEYRDYDVERTRFGGSLSLDFLAGDNTALYARVLHSKFEDQEFRGRLIFEMDEDPFGGDGNSALFSDADGEIKVIRDLKDRYEVQHITSLTLGGESVAGPWTLAYSAALGKADEKERGSLDPVEFSRDFDGDDELDVYFGYGHLTRPTYAVLDPGGLFTDPAEFEFDQIERTSRSLSKDEERTFKLDITRAFALENGELSLKAGGQLRTREKTFDLNVDVFDGFDGDFSLADVPGSQSYGLALIDPVPGRQLRDFVEANAGAFELNAFDSLVASSVEDYVVEEDILAGYLMGRFTSGPWRIVGGARVERTKADLRGNRVDVDDAEEEVTAITPVTVRHRYSDVLPSLNVRYEAAPDVLLRGAVYASVVRPRIGAVAPRFEIVDDEGEVEGVFGNPDLKPFRAWNGDLSAEWYLPSNGVLQGGVFYKRIKNPVLAVSCDAGDDIGVPFCAAGSYNGIAFDAAESWINGETAKVKGFEFAYQQSLSFLPGALDGLLVGLNYTWTDTDGRALDRSIPLPAAARNTYNAMLGYEKGPFSLRLTAAYRDEYLDELSSDPAEDRWVKDHLQWDLSVKYRLSPQLQMFAEFVNLGDEPYVAYQRGPGRDRLLQYEEYSWTAKAGVRLSF